MRRTQRSLLALGVLALLLPADYASAQFEATLSSDSLVSGANLGNLLSLDIDTTAGVRILAGARKDDAAQFRFESGTAYVFSWENDAWHEEARLKSPVINSYDVFGRAVALEGKQAFVSSSEDYSGSNSGVVYNFRRDGAQWNLAGPVTPAELDAGNLYGQAIDIHGDLLVVTSPGYTPADQSYGGAAYVFNYDGQDWIESARLTASDGVLNDMFGYAAATDGRKIVATALNKTVNDGSSDRFQAGGAYVFSLDNGQWVEEGILTASIPSSVANFGVSAAIAKDWIAIGNSLGGTFPNKGSGAVHLYHFDGANWEHHTRLVPPGDTTGFHLFGTSVALSGIELGPETGAIDNPQLLVGASNWFDTGDAVGSAFLFSYDRQTDEWEFTRQYLAADSARGDGFGTSVSMKESFVAIASPQKATVSKAEGAIYVYGEPPVTTAITSAEDGDPGIFLSAYPNPFPADVNVVFSVTHSGPVVVELFDLLGRRRAVAFDGIVAASEAHDVTVQTANLPSGVYVARVRTSVESITRTIVKQ